MTVDYLRALQATEIGLRFEHGRFIVISSLGSTHYKSNFSEHHSICNIPEFDS